MRKKGALNKKTSSLVLQTLVSSDRPLHIREIIRRTGLGNRTVVYVLRTLEGKGILKSFREKNKKYYAINNMAPLSLIIDFLGAAPFIQQVNRKEGEEGSIENMEPFKSLKLLTKIIGDFEGYMKTVRALFPQPIYEEIKHFNEIFDSLSVFDSLSAGITRILRVIDANLNIVEFMREEFLHEGIDIYEFSINDFLPLLIYFKENLDAYKELRGRGLNPEDALKWCNKYKWLMAARERKTIPATEWAFSKKRRRWLLPHPDEILRSKYGWKDVESLYKKPSVWR
jgi:hypothetical protein